MRLLAARTCIGLFVSIFLISSCSGRKALDRVETFDYLKETASGQLDTGRYRPVVGRKGMVVSDDREASEWGVSLLRAGGNAIDAAVGTAFALAVSRPHYAALGGGGFIVYCPAPQKNKPQPCQTIDYRERAPVAATRDMYVRDGKGDTDLSQHGALASGVPGVVAGLLFALDQFGTMKRGEVLARPIKMAEKGVRFSAVTEIAALAKWEHMNAEAQRIFGCGEKPCPVGSWLLQPELARVLREVRESGRDGFYKGWVANRLVSGIRRAGGILSEQDLAQYLPVLRKPAIGHFGRMEVVTMPPPSAGGTGLLQMLEYVELANQQGAFDYGFGSTPAIHALTHAMSLAFADRAHYFGDPDYVDVPMTQLMDPQYLRARWKKTYNPQKASLPDAPGSVSEKLAFLREHQQTTHFSVIDRWGNAVALTTTVNGYFGSGFVPPGTGVVMNNEMDDFSIQPGVPNLFGLVGAEANAVAPGKRPLSSMTPTIVRDPQGRVRLVLGAQGGPKITTSVFQAIVNRVHFGMTLPDAVFAPRIHHQWKPGFLFFEKNGLPPETRFELSKMGYELKPTDNSGRMQALERFPNGRVWGVADPRTEGAALAEE